MNDENNGLIVAITGQSGSGKSAFSTIYINDGHTVIDCDKIAATIHFNKECIDKLTEQFGEGILSAEQGDTADRIIDKKKLSKIAFSSSENLQKLTEITHPFIIREILEIITKEFKRGKRIVFVDGAVIIGYAFERYCDKIIVIISEKEKQYKRLMDRDNITRQEAQNRISQQMTVEKMITRADFVVYNNSTKESLTAQAEDILNQIIRI